MSITTPIGSINKEASLFQFHSGLDDLKKNLNELLQLANDGDCVLLLDKTPAYVDWLFNYIDESMDTPKLVWFALADDLVTINETAKEYLNFSDYGIQVLSDSQWVAMTQEVSKVITLS